MEEGETVNDLVGNLTGNERSSASGYIMLALAVSAAAHCNDYDAADAPMFLHTLRVAQRLAEARPYNLDAVIAGLLHDAAESGRARLDTLPMEIAVGDLACPLSLALHDTLTLLKRPMGLTYAAYIHRLAADPLAVQVKLADLDDNLNRRRMKLAPRPFRKSHEVRYLVARRYLLEAVRSYDEWLARMP
jgi:(p)ppGpp synthase/HD superfamily hydrolase